MVTNPCSEIDLEDSTMDFLSFLGARVRVHWHLRAKKWSVSYYSHLHRGWRVIRDNDDKQVLYTKVVLRDVDFTVRENGRQRVLKERRKNVHAWMEGTLLGASTTETEARVPCGITVKYNPYAFNQFYCEEYYSSIKHPVYDAEFAAAGTDNGVLVPEWAMNMRTKMTPMEVA